MRRYVVVAVFMCALFWARDARAQAAECGACAGEVCGSLAEACFLAGVDAMAQLICGCFGSGLDALCSTSLPRQQALLARRDDVVVVPRRRGVMRY